jgi:ketosteroid isomerase-like protein
MKFLPSLTLVTLLAACGSRSSDEQQVRALIVELENAAESRDTSDVLEHVAAGYEDAQGFDRAQLQNFLRGYFLSHPRIELLVNVEALQFPADGLAQAELSITSVSLNDPDRARVKVEFRREGDTWRLSRADRLQP